MQFSFTKKIFNIVLLSVFTLLSSTATGSSDTPIPLVVKDIFQGMGYDPDIQAKDMVIVYMDDDFKNPESHNIHAQINYNDEDERYSGIKIDVQKLLDKSKYLPNTESHYSNVTYSHNNVKYKRAVVCQLWGSRQEIFDRLNQKVTLRDLDIISHEISHCQLSRSASRFKSLEARYPGVYIWTIQKMDQLKRESPDIARTIGRYVIHVQEVFADIGSVMYLYNNTDFSEREKMAFIADLRDHRNKYNPFIINDLVTHYTGFYLDYILKHPETLKEAYEKYQVDPVTAVFDLAYKIGKDYSLTYDAFQKRFPFNN